MKKYFEYKDEVSNKFWQINLKGKQVIVTFGRVGIKNPHQIKKEFSTNEKAKKFAEKKIREKTNKGYREKTNKGYIVKKAGKDSQKSKKTKMKKIKTKVVENYEKVLKQLFKAIKTPKKSFNERILFYQQCYIDYKKWRNNFKFPKTTYLSKVKTLKPLPSNELVKNLAISISELREEYLKLKGYKPVLIFKLFLFYFGETFKAKNKIKINKSIGGPLSGWASGGKTPTRRDIDSIIDFIVINQFKFEDFLSDEYQKYKPGASKSSGGRIGVDWDWAKKKNFKWNPIWKPYNKKYGYQSNFAKEDHFRVGREERSLSKVNKMVKQYENLSNKNRAKDSVQIAYLFYELVYCKDFKKIDEIFDENLKVKTKIKNNAIHWQRLDSEKVPGGNKDFDLDWNLLEKFKQRVFPQFTFKNIKKKFDTSKFLNEVANTKDIKLSLIRAIDADDELVDGLEYDKLLPEYDQMLPAYTSGAIFNQLDKDLSFTTIGRTQKVTEELGESSEECYGILKSKKNNKYFFIHYHNDREGKTYCDLLCELKKSEFYKKPSEEIMKKIKSWKDWVFLPDRIVLNKEFKWNFEEIKKSIQPYVKEKIKNELGFVDYDPSNKKARSSSIKETLDDWREKRKYEEALMACRIYLLSQKEIDKEVNKGRGTGSVRFSLKTHAVNQDNLIDKKPYYIFK